MREGLQLRHAGPRRDQRAFGQQPARGRLVLGVAVFLNCVAAGVAVAHPPRAAALAKRAGAIRQFR
jgi:hypothetical protein